MILCHKSRWEQMVFLDKQNTVKIFNINITRHCEFPINLTINLNSYVSNLFRQKLQHFRVFFYLALLEAKGLPAHLFGSLGPRMHLFLHKTFNSGAGKIYPVGKVDKKQQ